MKCKDCGITLDGNFELEDGRCANCQADHIRTEAKKAFKATIDALDYLDEDDFNQDPELDSLYDELSSYFYR